MRAADALFAEKGPNAVTVREIAARAEVNHGLVHRHFGSKEALLDAVLDRHMAAFKTALRSAGTIDEAIPVLQAVQQDRPGFARMMAFLILERRATEDFTRPAGGTADLADIIRSGGPADDDAARAAAAMVTAFSLGWTLFRDFTVTAAGCRQSPGDMNRMAMAALLALARPPAEPQGPEQRPEQGLEGGRRCSPATSGWGSAAR
ncbi:TetR/AcrR family transcriptional regulator [Tistrella bauzanensis]